MLVTGPAECGRARRAVPRDGRGRLAHGAARTRARQRADRVGARPCPPPDRRWPRISPTASGSRRRWRPARSTSATCRSGARFRRVSCPKRCPIRPAGRSPPASSPRAKVAGDWYDAFPLTHGRIGLVIADVCDKGVGAALFMALMRSLIRAYAQQNYALRWLDVLESDAPSPTPRARAGAARCASGRRDGAEERRRTDEQLHRPHPRQHGHVRDDVLRHARHGDRPAQLRQRRPRGARRSSAPHGHINARLGATGLPIGVMPDGEFGIEQIDLAPGDILVSYTDGVPEARDPDRAFFTEKRLLALIEQRPAASAEALARSRPRCDRRAHRRRRPVRRYHAAGRPARAGGRRRKGADAACRRSSRSTRSGAARASPTRPPSSPRCSRMAGQRVGVIDTDIQSPGIHVLFGLDEEEMTYALNDYLWGKCAIEQAAVDVTDAPRRIHDRAHLPDPFQPQGGGDRARVARGVRRGAAQRRLPAADRGRSSLDVLLIDTHPGLNEETLLSIAISDALALIMRPDSQDYQGTGRHGGCRAEVGRAATPARRQQSADAPSPEADVLQRVQETYSCEVGAILPHSDEMMTLASSDIFALRFPDHPRHQASPRPGRPAGCGRLAGRVSCRGAIVDDRQARDDRCHRRHRPRRRARRNRGRLASSFACCSPSSSRVSCP